MHSLLAVLAIVSGAYEPGTVPPESTPQPSSSGRVVHVGRGGIQAAVDRARRGDTVRIRRGTYRGRVEIRGASKRGVSLVGDGATIEGAVGVRDTAAVTLRGVTVTRGVGVDHVDRYVLDRLRLAAPASSCGARPAARSRASSCGPRRSGSRSPTHLPRCARPGRSCAT